MQQTTTTNHQEIREWAEERGGMPALLAGTSSGLRFDWGEGDENVTRLSWEDFFDLFDEYGLAFAHIENDDSSVYEFITRNEALDTAE